MKALFGMILVLFRGSQQNPSHLFQIGVLHLHTKIPLTLPFSPPSLPPFSLSLSSSFSSQIFLLSSDRMKAPALAHTQWLFRPGRTHVRACVCWPISFVVVSVDKHEVEAAAAAEEKKKHTTHSLSLPPSLSLSHSHVKGGRESLQHLPARLSRSFFFLDGGCQSFNQSVSAPVYFSLYLAQPPTNLSGLAISRGYETDRLLSEFEMLVR